MGLSVSDGIEGRYQFAAFQGSKIFGYTKGCLNIYMKTYQLILRLNGVEVATIIHAVSAEQAKLIARSWGARVIGITEL